MERNGADREDEVAPPLTARTASNGSGRALSRRADPLLVVCRCFSFVTAITGLLCIAVNVLSAVRSFKNGSDVFDGIFRCYAVVIALVMVVAETEWSFIFRFWKID